MFARDVEMFIEHCENKGLATKTIGSYEQTLRLLMLWLDEQGIVQTEKITHVVIQDYVKQIKERGKYTVTSNPNSGNYQERRIDFGKKVSDVTINNYLRNIRHWKETFRDGTFYESWQCCNLLGGNNHGSICGIHQAAKGKRRFGF